MSLLTAASPSLRIAPVSSLSFSQARADALASSFVDHATDGYSLAGMVGGGLVYRLGRVGTLALGSRLVGAYGRTPLHLMHQPLLATAAASSEGGSRGPIFSSQSPPEQTLLFRVMEGEGGGGGDPSPPHSSLVSIPGGRFVMGSSDNNAPARIVEVSEYYLRKTRTTWAEYQEYAEAQGHEPFAIIGRSEKTRRMEVLSRGTEISLRAQFSAFQSLQERDPFPHGYELVNVVKPATSIPAGRGRHPITEVTWYQALGFADWWGRRYAGRPGTLPTEAEWERAARRWGDEDWVDVTRRMAEEGVTPDSFAEWAMGNEVKGRYQKGRFGRYENFVLWPEPDRMLELGLQETIFTNPNEPLLQELIRAGHRIGGERVFHTERGDFEDRAFHTSVVKRKEETRPADEELRDPNGLAIGGNAWEWVNDWYGPYQYFRVVNPTGTVKGSYRVLRGGAFNSGSQWMVRSAGRSFLRPDSGEGNNSGFRVALSQD